MRRIIPILILIILSALLPAGSAAAPQSVASSKVVRSDTITVNDTVMMRRVVHRYDVVSHMEELLRVDTVFIRGGKTELRIGKDLLPVRSEGDGLMAGLAADTVRVVVRDTVYADRAPGTLPVRDGGNYVWVPDSMSAPVAGLLAGNGGYDEKERVTFRGDTIPMMLRDRNLGRFNRGLFNFLFIPKGMWQFGITASYGEINTEDLEVLDLLSDIDISGKAFSIKPYFSYFIRNNLSVGMRLAYTYGKANVDSFGVDIDEDINFNLKDIEYRNETYTAALTLNQYFGIARRGRFGVFNEVELAFSTGTSDFKRPYNGEPKLTHTATTRASLNFSPGLSVFIMDPVSFHISFGVFGFTLRKDRQTVDGEDLGSRFTSGANFRFNIFNINFGVAVNL